MGYFTVVLLFCANAGTLVSARQHTASGRNFLAWLTDFLLERVAVKVFL
jgi:hypothetical protein